MKFRKKPVIIDAVKTEVPLEIVTLEGTMRAEPGDWIITGVEGERYPCKPGIFEKTYERMEKVVMLKPSVCRIVHYMAYGSKDGTYPSIERAAIITELTDIDGVVKLCVFNPSGIHFNTSTYSESKEPGTWSWPIK